jgi:hypothetical protein
MADNSHQPCLQPIAPSDSEISKSEKSIGLSYLIQGMLEFVHEILMSLDTNRNTHK